MDHKFCSQLPNALSSPSIGTELTAEFSPIHLGRQESLTMRGNDSSLQTLSKFFLDDSRTESPVLAKKPIFKILKENKTVEQPKMVLLTDVGNYNRKEKSLGELSRKILMMFGKLDKCVISLDSVAQQLGVERRRIYDIINILESLGVVYRKGKNSYQWEGLGSIHKTLHKLEHESLANEEGSYEDLDSDDEDMQKGQSKAKREKSLGILSTGFIKLFLSWKKAISLEQAGRKLSSENVEENKIKTKIRRLYDIANVFCSLGLIKKTCLESKKPAYEWVGIRGLEAFVKRLHTSSDEKEIFLELSSKRKEKVTPIQEKKTAEKQLSLNFHSTTIHAHTQFRAVETPVITAPTANPIDALFVALLGLYRQTPDKTPKIWTPSPSPISFGTTCRGLGTSSIKKSVSIIQRSEMDNDSGTDKYHILSGLKRKPTQDISIFENRTTKRLHSFHEYKRNECNGTQSLFLGNKENYSIGA